MELSKLPKVSLHDHFDGGLRPASILEIAKREGIAVPAETAADLASWFVESCSGGELSEYLKTFELTVAVMQKRDDLVRLAKEYTLDLAADGVVYAEMRWAPEQHTRAGLSMAEAIHAVQTGIEEAQNELEESGVSIKVGQILCAMRQNDKSLEVARHVLQFRDAGVVGFDLAGPEDGFWPEAHEPALRLLAENYVPVTLHAGEEGDLRSIRSAIFHRAQRLGHGTRLALDLELEETRDGNTMVAVGEIASWVRDREITLEMCPSSNLQTGSSPWGESLADHPFDVLYRLGMRVTVSCDNRLMSGTTLTRELALLADEFGYSPEDILEFQLNAAMGAFLPLDERFELVEQLEEGFASLTA